MGCVFSSLAQVFLYVGEFFENVFLLLGEILSVLTRGIFTLLVGICDILAAASCCCRVPYDQRPDRGTFVYSNAITKDVGGNKVLNKMVISQADRAKQREDKLKKTEAALEKQRDAKESEDDKATSESAAKEADAATKPFMARFFGSQPAKKIDGTPAAAAVAAASGKEGEVAPEPVAKGDVPAETKPAKEPLVRRLFGKPAAAMAEKGETAPPAPVEKSVDVAAAGAQNAADPAEPAEAGKAPSKPFFAWRSNEKPEEQKTPTVSANSAPADGAAAPPAESATAAAADKPTELKRAKTTLQTLWHGKKPAVPEKPTTAGAAAAPADGDVVKTEAPSAAPAAVEEPKAA
ncbi:hypothetical protein BDZ90DRAFT_61982 [Jaminaea rosea]|uniref:Uncharacterized protein n=1 Tax=Jaminaea rosea TaxID=1569628 RepID=A0A316UKD7_9BASI|nr:hypothetical protein BDZ90DRAFT_61982 [Jaminaea rosea]PWN25762.1 hypothetical protein BDZ90DRAFT_61982 [Jaminaea rosea]